MEGTDVCYSPVLSMSEAYEHPPNVARKTFVEVGVLMFENRNRENPVIPIGIRSDRKTVVNPRDGNDMKLEAGDKLVVIAFEEPDSLV